MSLILGDHGGDHGVGHAGGADHIGSFDHAGGLDHAVGMDHAGGFDHAAGAGAGHVADAGHTAGAQHASDSSDTPSPFNPLVIASAISTFGAVGIISMKGFGISGLMSTIISLGVAGAIGAALFFGIVKFMYGSQSNSIYSLDELAGTEAEVITPVPEKGLGEIAYVANGIRYTQSARSMEGSPIKRGAAVIIREIAGNVAVVQQKLTLDDIEINYEEQENKENGKPRRDAGNN
ncbi:MAG TPA: hypothetical protein VHT96_04005 [Clostridia bacterium]|nr:hypothetical protein [Clostridia bacterium]